jgi:Flp pilus assembly protein TadD
VITLSAIGVYFYFDARSVDAHLASATQAKLVEDTKGAIREYRKALAQEDNPHTRKLLAIELANAGNVTEAISEFRLARERGEPDDTISFRLGVLLERMNLTNQAKLEYERFLQSETCLREEPLCEVARGKLGADTLR